MLAADSIVGSLNDFSYYYDQKQARSHYCGKFLIMRYHGLFSSFFCNRYIPYTIITLSYQWLIFFIKKLSKYTSASDTSSRALADDRIKCYGTLMSISPSPMSSLDESPT